MLTAAFLAAPAYFIYMNAKDLVVSDIGNSAVDIAVTAAAFIEKDIEKFAQLPAYVYTPDPDGDTPPAPPAATDTNTGSMDAETDTPKGYSYDLYYNDPAYDPAYDPFYDEDFYEDFDEDFYDEDFYEDFDEDFYDEDFYDDEFDDEFYDDDFYDPRSGGISAHMSGGSSTGGDIADSAPPAPQSALSDEYFTEITALLKRISVATGAAEIYIEKRMSDKKKGFVFQTDQIPDRFFSNELTEEELLAFNEGVESSSDLLHDQALGEYLVGYAPITDSKTGASVGLVVVEFALSDAESLMSGITMIIIISFSVILLLTAFVVHRLYASRVKYRSRDVLTALCNKHYFEKHLLKAMRHARASGRPLCLMMIDVDRFKTINDTMGHGAGDDVLKAVSKALLRCTRRSDACCRYGGDEFVITLPGTNAVQAAVIAERLRQEVSGLVFESAGRTFGVTLSIGIAELGGGMSADAFKELADRLMYISKNSGKNRITVREGAPIVQQDLA
jgi:diguanylate cyclase (GGDEF)-like protein